MAYIGSSAAATARARAVPLSQVLYDNLLGRPLPVSILLGTLVLCMGVGSPPLALSSYLATNGQGVAAQAAKIVTWPYHLNLASYTSLCLLSGLRPSDLYEKTA